MVGVAFGTRVGIVIVDSPSAIVRKQGGGGNDQRFQVLRGVALELRRRGHEVLLAYPADFGLRTTRGEALMGRFARLTSTSRPDCVITWWGRPSVIPTGSDHWHTLGLPYLIYENGMTQGAVIVDPRGLLGGSFYHGSVDERSRRDVDDEACSLALTGPQSQSKRPQPGLLDDVPAEALRDFIFVPTQKADDRSISEYSTVTMQGLLERVEHAQVDAYRVLRIIACGRGQRGRADTELHPPAQGVQGHGLHGNDRAIL